MPQGSVAAALGKASSSGPGRVLARTRCDSGGDRSQACRKRRERAPEPCGVPKLDRALVDGVSGRCEPVVSLALSTMVGAGGGVVLVLSRPVFHGVSVNPGMAHLI